MTESKARTTELYEALRAAGDPTAIVALARREPEILDDAFLALLDGWITDADAEGNAAAVTGLTQRQTILLELRSRRDREAALPPLSGALMAFLRADDEAAARVVFNNQHTLLDSTEAQRALAQSFKSDDAVGQARIAARAALLKQLRNG